MNAVVQEFHGEIVDGTEFFAPASTDLVDGLLGQYKMLRADVEQIAALVDQHKAAVGYFVEGNKQENSRDYRSVSQIFKLDGAIGALNADFWQRALKMTDVYDYMPNNRREEWNEQIRNPLGEKAARLNKWDIEDGKVQQEWKIQPLPDFEEEAVRSTLEHLLLSRQQFFSERVDGLFRALSGEHVTNRPEGFGKRMILARVYNEYGHTEYKTSGYIQDLRIIIAKFMGRDEPRWNATDAALNAARRRPGEWLTLDGGALRVRGYLKGTAHLEVHPEMAWRLNCILAQLYPLAIPPQFRQKPKRKLKDFVLMGKPLPFAVLGQLAGMKAERHEPWRGNKWDEPRQPLTTNPFNRVFSYHSDYDKAVRAQAEQVLESIGGVKVMAGPHGNVAIWEFDYEPEKVLEEVIASGCIPDRVSHQFYPTPDGLAEMAVSFAEIVPGDVCLEPSAGTGSLAKFMPVEQTSCVEVSALHCKVLAAKGFDVTQADFLKLAADTPHRFDKVVMNPPFSEGRAKAHTEAAASLVRSGGRLVAILPSGMRHTFDLPGWSVSWTKIHENEFEGTSVNVVIMIADRY